MHLLTLLLIKFRDCQSNFCIAYIRSFRSKWQICKEICKLKTFKTLIHRNIIILGFLGEQSTYKGATWIRISFQALSSWIICNGKQSRLRIVFWFWTDETFVLNTGWKNKLKSILVQVLASPLGLPPKGTSNIRMDKEQNSLRRENCLGVLSKNTMKILRGFQQNSEDAVENFFVFLSGE